MEIENLKLQKQIDELIDKIYPVGSYYETSNGSFNPNTNWGGKWVKDTNGYVTVGASQDSYGSDLAENGLLLLVGMVEGETHHTLTVDEMPSHNHGNMFVSSGNGDKTQTTDTFTSQYINAKGFDWLKSKGGDLPHNNIQPSIGVYRWHRTA